MTYARSRRPDLSSSRAGPSGRLSFDALRRYLLGLVTGEGKSMIRAWHRFSSAAVVILGLSLASVAGHAQSSAEDDAGLVARGEYLARAADCMPCHSGDRSKPYSGGLPIHTPFGTIFSVNITSDPQTGIGRW